MDETLWHKFTQYPDLKQRLLSTGDAELIHVCNVPSSNDKPYLMLSQNSNKDNFWGLGIDRQGRNELGKALERLRTKLRDS